MKTLLLMRHAKSDWGSPELSDHERPLNPRGRRAAPLMGRLLQAEGLVPDAIVCSDAVRANETARLVADACDIGHLITTSSRLYLAEPQAYVDLLTEVPPGTQRLLVVGHNPGISALVHKLTNSGHDMPTAAVARIDLEVGEIAEVDWDSPAELVDYWKPRDLE